MGAQRPRVSTSPPATGIRRLQETDKGWDPRQPLGTKTPSAQPRSPCRPQSPPVEWKQVSQEPLGRLSTVPLGSGPLGPCTNGVTLLETRALLETGRWTHPRGGHLQAEGSAGQREAVQEGLGRHAWEETQPGRPGLLPAWGAAIHPTSPRAHPAHGWGSSCSPLAPPSPEGGLSLPPA